MLSSDRNHEPIRANCRESEACCAIRAFRHKRQTFLDTLTTLASQGNCNAFQGRYHVQWNRSCEVSPSELQKWPLKKVGL